MHRDETQSIAVALDALLTALRSEDRHCLADVSVQRDLDEAELDFLARTPSEHQAARLSADPVRQALRNAIQDLGLRVHELGGAALAMQITQSVAALDARQGASRLEILAKLWRYLGDDEPG